MLRNRLRELRESAGVTQKEIADYLNIGHSTYNRYECSSREPDLETLIRLADYFHVSLDDLIGHSIPGGGVELLQFLQSGNYRIYRRVPTDREKNLFCRLIMALYADQPSAAASISKDAVGTAECAKHKKKS